MAAALFPRSASSVHELAVDTNQQPPPSNGTSTTFIDASLAIIIKAGEYHRELQEKGIRREFINQREYIDNRFDEQREYVDARFEVQRVYMDARFERVEK